MASQVRLFISAGPPLEPERELLGRALAELPLNPGWVIKRTPDVDSVAECHLFVVLLGEDIVAPVGLELWWARRTEKRVLAYHLAPRRTPAAQVFLQENAPLDWRRPADQAALRRAFLRDVTGFVLTHADRYGIGAIEAELCRAYLQRLEQSDPRPAPAKATGAAGGGVILAPGRDAPRGARLVGEEPA
jgi:hypothetical protein